MRVLITGVTYPDRKIHAIKGVRAATGLGLKEAKHVIDDLLGIGYPGCWDHVPRGPQTVELAGDPLVAASILTEYGIHFDPVHDEDEQFRQNILNVLLKMPRHLKVQEVIDVMTATEPLF